MMRWQRICGILIWAILCNILAAVLNVELTWRLITLVVVMNVIGDVIFTLTEPPEKAIDHTKPMEP